MYCRMLGAWAIVALLYLTEGCLAFPASSGQTAREQKPRRMNNFVTDLLRVDLGTVRHQVREFANPRAGWVFLATPKTSGSHAAQVWVALDGAPRGQAILALGTASGGEAMRYLAGGTHRVEVWTDGKAAGILTVRAIPEIIFLRFTGDPQSPDGSLYRLSDRAANGADRLYLYYWDWLAKHVLRNVNVIQGGFKDNAALAQWVAVGRKEIVGAHFFSKEPEELLTSWRGGFRSPFSGVIVDEFVPPTGDLSQRDKDLGGYRPGLGFEPGVMEVIRRLHADPGLSGTFYAYLGMPWDAKAENCRMLMETLMACDYKWVWEAYLWEQSSEAEAAKYLDTAFRQRMLDFRTTYPGSEKHCIVCPAILEAWDSFPDFDFKVWLDMQFQMMATDPAFADIYGVTAYQSTTADPELVCWLSRLYRHYCIEGKTAMVSPEYGYTLTLRHLANPGFADGTAGWTVSPAATGSVRAVKTSQLAIRKGYLPKGDSVLVMKRNGAQPNLISQEIRNLRPGRLYSLRFYTCDLTDLAARKKHAQSVKLEGVSVIEERSRQDIQQGDGAGANTACWNYTYRVFEATTDKGRIEISDWADTKTPGGPVGQDTLFDFIQVQPLFQP